MILFIDTSARPAVVATIDRGEPSELHLDARSRELYAELRRLAAGRVAITKVAVVTGPGSFTGLRVGVSFGLGLAIGRKIPIVPLPTLDLQAARSSMPAIAVVEAGRGRLYYLAPGGTRGLGDPAEIPVGLPIVGRVSPATRADLERAGHSLAGEEGLLTEGAAAAIMLETAREVAYGSLKLEYMQTFSGPTRSEPSAGFRGDP